MAAPPDWTSLDWDHVLDLVHGSASEGAGFALAQLMQAIGDSMEDPISALCAGIVTGACAAGIMMLRVLTIGSLVNDGKIARSAVPLLLKSSAEAFAQGFGPDLKGGTLDEEFGYRQQRPVTLPRTAFSLLGRVLYDLAGLPPPGPAVDIEPAEVEPEELGSRADLSSEAAPTSRGAVAGAADGDGQFEFGQNWQQFVEQGRISPSGVGFAVQETRRAIGGSLPSLQGLRVLDIGCGSGLQSLAFHLQGARVLSVDRQPAALEATLRLRDSFSFTDGASGSTSQWHVEQASALDTRRLAALEPVDIIYSWGVLHHTGDVWRALHTAQLPLREEGMLLVALYAAEFYDEKDNLMLMKRAYRRADAARKVHLEIAVGLSWLRPSLRSQRNLFEVIREFGEQRGMDFWTDVRDWLGGWPMEFTSTTEVLAFARRSGLRCVGVRRYGGNTEFQFVRPTGVARWTAGRICRPLRDLREDTKLHLENQVMPKFYYHGDRVEAMPPRRWWRAPLPEGLRELSDTLQQPQRDRLLMLDASGEPFGYPSAQFARPDALAEAHLQFFAFWDGEAYVSPAITQSTGLPSALDGLVACALPAAELLPEDVEAIRAIAAQGLAELGSKVSDAYRDESKA